MPTAALSPCRVCHQVGCIAHPKTPWQRTRQQSTKRTTGRRLQRERNQLFDREPLCRPCHQKGRITLATIRDHIVPLAEGGQDTPDNTQPICQNCHDAKTTVEAQRGARRWGV